MSCNFEEVLFLIDEELRTRPDNNIHHILRNPLTPAVDKVSALLQLRSTRQLAPSGSTRLSKNIDKANEWLTRATHCPDISERLTALNKAAQCAPISDSALGTADQGVALVTAVVQRHACLSQLGSAKDLENNIQYLRELLTKLPESLLRDFDDVEEQLAELECGTPEEVVAGEKLYGGHHYKLQGVSALLNLHYVEGRGRCLVASEDVPAGSLLAVETSYVWSLSPELWSSHCHYCCRPAPAAVPCHSCAAIVFCSVTCRKRAWERFHAAECSLLNALHAEWLSPEAVLAARAILTAGWEEVLKHVDGDTAQTDRVDKHRVLAADHYSSLLHLQPVSQRHDISICTRQIATAIFLSRCLSAASGPQAPTGATEPQLAATIWRHMLLAPSNMMSLQQRAGDGRKRAIVGHAINPALSLINHGCFPNAVCVNSGTHFSLYSSRAIARGDEVLLCYGERFDRCDAAARHSNLFSRYGFRCVCEACRGEWPVRHPINEHEEVDTLTSEKDRAELVEDVEKCQKQWDGFSPPSQSLINSTDKLVQLLWDMVE